MKLIKVAAKEGENFRGHMGGDNRKTGSGSWQSQGGSTPVSAVRGRVNHL